MLDFQTSTWLLDIQKLAYFLLLVFAVYHFDAAFSDNPILFIYQSFFWCGPLCGCPESSLLWEGFLWLWRAEATVHCGARASHYGGFSRCRAQPLGAWASVVAARRLSSMVHGLRCSATCGIFLDQGSNPCPLHWQVDSYPLYHQGNPWQPRFQLQVRLKPRALSPSVLYFWPSSLLMLRQIQTFSYFVYYSSPFLECKLQEAGRSVCACEWLLHPWYLQWW